jgi:Domain of unknown function (DUF4260)
MTPRLTADGTHDPGGGTVTGTPRTWLRGEAAVLLAGSLIAYSGTRQPWWLVPLVVLLPDLAMAGYLAGTRAGAVSYNLAHATPLPAVMVVLGWWQHRPLILALGLVWLAHIGLDRLLGYGLKYGDNFQHTHLGRLGGDGQGRTSRPRNGDRT